MFRRQTSYFPTGVIFIALGCVYVSSGKSTDMEEYMTYQTEQQSCYLVKEYSYIVSGRKGMTTSPDVYLRSEVYSKDKIYVIKLTCYAFLQPFGESVSFLLNSYQMDGIRNHENKCFHKDGPCLPGKCSCCSNEGFYAFFLILKKTDIKDVRTLSCEMRHGNNNAKRIASIDLDYTDFTATEWKPSIKESNSKISGPRTPENKEQDKIKDTIEKVETDFTASTLNPSVEKFNPDDSKTLTIAKQDLSIIKETGDNHMLTDSNRTDLSAIAGGCFLILLMVLLLCIQRRTQRSIFTQTSKIMKMTNLWK